MAPLSTSEGFPAENPIITTSAYKKLVDNFLDELSVLNNETQLYYLFEKYLWCVPAQTTNYVPDISLFDHAKTTAAIALCLYDEYTEGLLTPGDLNKMTQNNDKHFMLIHGDVSGIQDFIFNIPSEGAAKSLKAHSVYIGLLADVVARYLIKEMKLKEANILYNGGGNFYILAPKVAEDKFQALKKKVSQMLLKFHGGEIYIALDYILLSPADFEDFNKQWDKIKQRVNLLKNKKWAEIGLQEHHQLIFGPFGVGSKDNDHCQLCGIEKENRNVIVNPENEKIYCTFCNSFMDMTNELKIADCLVIKEVTPTSELVIREYQDMFRAFGYEYRFAKKELLSKEDRKLAFLLNDTNFLKDGFRGYWSGMYLLPYNEQEKRQYNFGEISEKSTGDPKLGFLKLDVDNLGDLFCRGLGEKSTISRVTSLSRLLAQFFEGYINYLIKINNWQDYLYVVFSGGDDTFVIGAWDKIIDFVQEFNNKFRKFTCYNPQVTFSAGICVFSYDYPVIIAAQLTEEALEKAKEYCEKGEYVPSKNKISLFGEVFSWEEFSCIQDIKGLLLEIMENNIHKGKGETSGRTFLYKIWKSTLGFKRILQDSVRGKVDNVRFWRLAYYLRDISHKDAEILIEKYREIVINNLLEKSNDKKIRNIMVIPSAVKCAQMETRNIRGRYS